jgi:hypothetical protein
LPPARQATDNLVVSHRDDHDWRQCAAMCAGPLSSTNSVLQRVSISSRAEHQQLR